MRKEFYIDSISEDITYNKLLRKIKYNKLFKIDNTSTLILNVSPDYSSIISQKLRHALSTDGEVIDVMNIEVPYPDETDNTWYINKIQTLVQELFINDWYENFIFVEAGIIRGGNYKMIEDLFLKSFNKEQLLFTALFENTQSKFQSKCVGEYYNNDTQDLTFYWETYNKHWK